MKNNEITNECLDCRKALPNVNQELPGIHCFEMVWAERKPDGSIEGFVCDGCYEKKKMDKDILKWLLQIIIKLDGITIYYDGKLHKVCLNLEELGLISRYKKYNQPVKHIIWKASPETDKTISNIHKKMDDLLSGKAF